MVTWLTSRPGRAISDAGILGPGLGKDVLLITDGRFSGVICRSRRRLLRTLRLRAVTCRMAGAVPGRTRS
jgi:hypothetical protein